MVLSGGTPLATDNESFGSGSQDTNPEVQPKGRSVGRSPDLYCTTVRTCRLCGNFFFCRLLFIHVDGSLRSFVSVDKTRSVSFLSFSLFSNVVEDNKGRDVDAKARHERVRGELSLSVSRQLANDAFLSEF